VLALALALAGAARGEQGQLQLSSRQLASGTAAFERFGLSLDAAGSRLVVASSGTNPSFLDEAKSVAITGVLKVLIDAGSQFDLEHEFTVPQLDNGKELIGFGSEAVLNDQGDVLATIGAYECGNFKCTALFVYTRSGSTWSNVPAKAEFDDLISRRFTFGTRTRTLAISPSGDSILVSGLSQSDADSKPTIKLLSRSGGSLTTRRTFVGAVGTATFENLNDVAVSDRHIFLTNSNQDQTQVTFADYQDLNNVAVETSQLEGNQAVKFSGVREGRLAIAVASNDGVRLLVVASSDGSIVASGTFEETFSIGCIAFRGDIFAVGFVETFWGTTEFGRVYHLSGPNLLPDSYIPAGDFVAGSNGGSISYLQGCAVLGQEVILTSPQADVGELSDAGRSFAFSFVATPSPTKVPTASPVPPTGRPTQGPTKRSTLSTAPTNAPSKSPTPQSDASRGMAAAFTLLAATFAAVLF